MKRALIVAAFLVLATASSDKKEDADIKEIRSLVEDLLKDGTDTKNDDVIDSGKKVSDDPQDRELSEKSDVNNIDETASEWDLEPIVERGLDDDTPQADSVKVNYADETDETRELAAKGAEDAPIDGAANDEYSRSLDELDTAVHAEPSLDVEDRATSRYYGATPTYRTYLDGWRNAMYIPTQTPLKSGRIIQWQFYARRRGRIYLQVWRRYYVRGRTNTYQLVGMTYRRVTRLGANIVTANIAVKDGDLIGFYFPYLSIIPFSGWECSYRRTLYVRSPRSIRVNGVYQFSSKQSGWKPCRTYSFRAKVSSGTSRPTYTYQRKFIGNSAIPHGERDTWNNAMYIPNPDKYMPADGYIYRWRFYAKTAGVIIYLQVFRRVQRAYMYTLVDQTKYYVTRVGYQYVNVKINVKRYDRIGFSFPMKSVIPFTISSRYCSISKKSLYVRSPSIRIGATYQFRPMLQSWRPCRRYSFGAYIGLTRPRKRELEAEEKSNVDKDAEKDFISGV